MKTSGCKILIIFFAAFSLASCSAIISGEKGQVQAPPVPLSCIAVLPATTSVGDEERINYEHAKMLETGAKYVDTLLQQELATHSKVRLLSSSQLDNLIPEVEGGLSGAYARIGQKINCDGVLITTVSRFKQREGSSMAAESPASAEFRMVLRHSGNGAVLWSADFQETQDSFLMNIFSYSKMQRQGFRWLSVEQLMEQGVSQRIAECPYL